jgi:aspartokinase-like uncharacterized kinase
MMKDGPGLLPATVVKVGGSLLELKDLAARLRGLFSLIEHAGGIAVVVGGGPAADLVRRWDEQSTFSDLEAHRLAIRAMRLTEMLLSSRVPECGQVIAELEECRGHLAEDQRIILSIEALLDEAAKEFAPRPPASWDVTSDTLAAWAAKLIGVRRLVLAKSVDCPAEGLTAAVKAGLVDPLFERTSEGLDVSWVNLRKEPVDVVQLI